MVVTLVGKGLASELLTEDLHEWVWLKLGCGPAGASGLADCFRVSGESESGRSPLFLPFFHRVAEQSSGLLLVSLSEVVRKPAIFASYVDGVSVEHHLAALHPDRPGAHVLDGLGSMVHQEYGA